MMSSVGTLYNINIHDRFDARSAADFSIVLLVLSLLRKTLNKFILFGRTEMHLGIVMLLITYVGAFEHLLRFQAIIIFATIRSFLHVKIPSR